LRDEENSLGREGEVWGREVGRGVQQGEASGSLTKFQHSQVAGEHQSLVVHNSSPGQLVVQLVHVLVVVEQDLAAGVPG